MIRIYGNLAQTGNVEITHYGKSVETKIVEIAPDGSWTFDREANSRGDYESYYTFKFPDGLVRKVFLDRSLPSKISFADLIKGAPDTAPASPEPTPNLIQTIDDRIAKAGINTGIETAIADLNPDKYLGTIGLLADKPVGATKTHYTAWPAADAGAWLWAKSDTTINGQEILTDQNWVCLEDGTLSQTPSKWELSQKGAKKLYYPTHVSCIGDYRRTLDVGGNIAIPSSNTQALYVPFYSASTSGIFDDLYTADSDKRAGVSDLYNLVLDDVELDFEVEIKTQDDTSGDRSAAITLLTYYPDGNKFGLLLEAVNIQTNSVPAANTRETSVPVRRARVRLPKTDPIDENPLTYAIGVQVSQNSGGPLNLIFATLLITAWK